MDVNWWNPAHAHFEKYANGIYGWVCIQTLAWAPPGMGSTLPPEAACFMIIKAMYSFFLIHGWNSPISNIYALDIVLLSGAIQNKHLFVLSVTNPQVTSRPLFNFSLWDHYFSYSLPQTPTLVLGSSKAPYYWLLLYYVGSLPLNAPTSGDLGSILLLIEPCDLWFTVK